MTPKNGYPVPTGIPNDETVTLVVRAGWVKWLDVGASDAWSWEETDPDPASPQYGRRFVMEPVPVGRRCVCGHWESEHDLEAEESGCMHGWLQAAVEGCLCVVPEWVSGEPDLFDVEA